jgi:phosphopantothenate-cysteine ligase
VGFKLLVGSTESELVEAARKSVEENGCDFVVANDLNDIKAGNHKIIVVDKLEAVNIPKSRSVDTIISKMETLHATTIRRNR